MRDSQPFRELFHGARIAWQCLAGHYSLGLTPICPIPIVICVDDSDVHDAVERQEGIRFFSLERETGRRQQDRESSVDEILLRCRDEIQTALRQESGSRLVLAASIPSRSFAAFAEENGYELISNPPGLTAWLSDKANLIDALELLGLPAIPGRWTRLPESRYAELAAELGSSFVAQLACGAGGSGTRSFNRKSIIGPLVNVSATHPSVSPRT